MLRRCTRLLLLAVLLIPGAAYAQANLTCTGGAPTPNTYLYNVSAAGGVCSGVGGLQNIFTGLVCNFETLLNAIMGSVYCGIQYAMATPLAIALIVFVMVFGIQIVTGHTQARIGEIFVRVFKMTLIWVFATDATYGIGIAYNFFMGAINEGVGLVFKVIPIAATFDPDTGQFIASLPPASGGFCSPPIFDPGTNSEGQAFAYIDYMLCTIITGPFTAQGSMLAGFFAVMAWMIPPIFMMFSYFFIKSIKIMVRALFVYLLAISSIAFLITLSPIFISFALFGPTRHFFEDWLRFLISFTLQIILIFAGIAMWLTVILQLTGFLSDLTTMIRPVQETAQGIDARLPLNTWGICQYTQQETFWGPILQCADSPVPAGGLCNGQSGMAFCPAPLKPSQLIEHADFVYFLVINLVAICTVAYTFDALMTLLPTLAKQLAGPAHAPQLGGGGGGMGGVNFGNFLSLESTGKQSRNFTESMQKLLGGRGGGIKTEEPENT